MSCPPILFLIFNRPELTQQVFARIREAGPKQLFVAADGPRPDHPGEEQICAETRKIVKKVDWPCELMTLFRDKNIGCKHAVRSAIDWFFSHSSEGIILEDDCVPHYDFFSFCDAALTQYDHSENMMHIGGTVLINDHKLTRPRLSRLVPIWGWATWRRAWTKYDDRPELLNDLDKKLLRNHYRSQAKNVEAAIRNNFIVDSWDAQWAAAVMRHHGMSLLPPVNLISNIGFSTDSTHTKTPSALTALATYPLPDNFSLFDPYPVSPKFDEAYLSVQNNSRTLIRRIKNRIIAWIGI